MSIRFRRVASGIAAAAVLASLAAGPASAQTITETNHFVFPQVFTIVNPCTGDALSFTGDFVAITHVTVTDAGHVVVVSNGHSSREVGVDLTTGQTFRLLSSAASVGTFQASGAPSEFTVGLTNNFVGQGPANNLIQHELQHITINANGEVSASLDQVSIECR